jgi:hypothetical protein
MTVNRYRYPVLRDGEGVTVNPGEIVKFACCDCGLVHDVAFAYENGEIGIALRRNVRATAQRRRQMRKRETMAAD